MVRCLLGSRPTSCRPPREFLPGTGQPLLSLRFSILQVRLTSHFPSFTHFARSAREAGLLFRACDSMGGTLVGVSNIILFFARWLRLDAEEVPQATLSGRMRDWADFLASDLHHEDHASLPAEPLAVTIAQVETLLFQSLPTTPEDFAPTLSTIFQTVPDARFFGAPFGTFCKAVRVHLRPRTPLAEYTLAGVFRPALALVPSFRVTNDTVWLSLPHLGALPATATATPAGPPCPALVQHGIRPSAPAPAEPPSSSDILSPSAFRSLPHPSEGSTRPQFGFHAQINLPSGFPSLSSATLPLGRRIPRPPWLLFDAQEANLCAVHAINHILQTEFPWFSSADLREGAELASMADTIAGVASPPSHSTEQGDFSCEAVGRALARRRFDWRGVRLHYDGLGAVDIPATVEGAFGHIDSPAGRVPILGVFVHQGAHYTTIIRRNDVLFHVDSLIYVSGSGEFVFHADTDLFVQYVERFVGRSPPPGTGPLYSRPACSVCSTPVSTLMVPW